MRELPSVCRTAEEMAMRLVASMGYPTATWLHLQWAYDQTVAIGDMPPPATDPPAGQGPVGRGALAGCRWRIM